MNFVKGFSLTSITSIIVTLLAMFNNIVITRHLGPSGRGKYVILSNIIILVSLVLGEGIRRTNTILVGNERRNIHKINFLNFIYVLSLCLITIIFFAFTNIWYYYLPNIENNLVYITIFIALLMVYWQSIQAMLLGLEKIYEYNIVQILFTSSVLTINLFGILFYNFDLFEILLSNLIASVIVLISCLKISRFEFKIQHLDFNYIRINSIPLILKSTILAIFSFLTLKGDIFLINFFLGTSKAGIYSIAGIFLDVFQKIPNAIGQIVISKTAKGNSNNNRINISRVVRVVIFTNIFIVIILFFLSKNIIILLFGESFIDSYIPLCYLLPSFVLYSPGSIIQAYFIGKGYPNAIIIINVITFLINILANFLLIPHYGIIIAALISSVTYLFWAISLLSLFHRDTQITWVDILFIKKNDIMYINSKLKITHYFKKNS